MILGNIQGQDRFQQEKIQAYSRLMHSQIAIVKLQSVRQMLSLFERRKALIVLKQQKLRQEYNKRVESMRRFSSDELSDFTSKSSDPDIKAMYAQIKNMQKLKKTLVMINKQNNLGQRIKNQNASSSNFWAVNKKLQADIDNYLYKLKDLDSKTDRISGQQFTICKQIDQIQQRIKDLLVSKVSDHVKRAQPLYQDKQNKHNILMIKQQQRQMSKQQKIHTIQRMMGLLQRLKGHRQQRLRSLADLMGIADSTADFLSKLNYYDELSDQLQKLVRSKDSLGRLDTQEVEIQRQLNQLSEQITKLTQQLTQKSSQQAKTFMELGHNYRQRLKIFTLQKVLNSQVISDVSTPQLKDLNRKVKQYKNFLSSFSNEENQVRQGLLRTQETLVIFRNILLAIRSQKQRKQQMLRLLQHIGKLNADEANFKQKIRQLNYEIDKKKHLQKNYQQDLAGVVSQANLDQYKKYSNQINTISNDQIRMQAQLHRYQQKLTQVRGQVLNVTDLIRDDFDDILKEVMQKQWLGSHDLSRQQDLRSLHIYLKKTLKRLGI